MDTYVGGQDLKTGMIHPDIRIVIASEEGRVCVGWGSVLKDTNILYIFKSEGKNGSLPFLKSWYCTQDLHLSLYFLIYFKYTF